MEGFLISTTASLNPPVPPFSLQIKITDLKKCARLRPRLKSYQFVFQLYAYREYPNPDSPQATPAIYYKFQPHVKIYMLKTKPAGKSIPNNQTPFCQIF